MKVLELYSGIGGMHFAFEGECIFIYTCVCFVGM